MKKSFIILLMVINMGNCYAQDNISIDSLLILFQTENVYKVLGEIDKNRNFISIDSVRSDMRLKPYFMEAMNKDTYSIYYLDKKREETKKMIFNEDMVNFLKHNCKIENVDSIMKNPQLYTIYYDSLLNRRMQYDIKNFTDSFPYEILFVLRYLHYPEGYTYIKEEWINRGKCEDSFLESLLWYNDHEAWETFFDKKVEEMVKTNGETKYFESVTKILDNYSWQSHPYVVKKSLEMLDITREVKLLPYRIIIVPYWKFVLFNLAERVLRSENIYLNSHEDYVNKKDFIIEKAKEYVEKSKQKDAEWMKDIPYYRSNDVSKK